MTDIEKPSAIIVGAGIAGTAAALELAECGVRFLGVDLAPEPGGTARRGGIGSSIAGSPSQKALGIADDWQLAFADCIADGNNPDPLWSRFYYRRSAADVHGWFTDLGTSFQRIVHYEGDSVARWHLPEGGGTSVMGAAWSKLAELGAADCWIFGARVIDLISENHRISGVRLRHADGREENLHAPMVLLAAGGFGANVEMARQVSPRFASAERLLAGGNPTSQGQLHDIVRRHGGKLTKMQDVYAYANGTPDYRDPEARRGVVVRNIRNCIWVNRDGLRFHNEDVHICGRSATDDLLDQPGQTAFVILDEAAIPEMFIQDHYQQPGSEPAAATVARFLAHSPYFTSADSLQALTEDLGLPSARVAKTVSSWNALLASGAERDALTGRPLSGLRALGQGRWHAIRFFPLLRKTLGGVRTDLKCRVLDENDALLPGLFAAGELAGMGGGGMAGARPLEGTMAGGSLFSGRIAGRWMARTLERGRA